MKRAKGHESERSAAKKTEKRKGEDMRGMRMRVAFCFTLVKRTRESLELVEFSPSNGYERFAESCRVIRRICRLYSLRRRLVDFTRKFDSVSSPSLSSRLNRRVTQLRIAAILVQRVEKLLWLLRSIAGIMNFRAWQK